MKKACSVLIFLSFVIACSAQYVNTSNTTSNLLFTQKIAPQQTANNFTGEDLMSTLSTKHFIGESFGGGKVFSITSDSLHGLIAETIDQCVSCDWSQANPHIGFSRSHSTEGKKFTDWRLPTKSELKILWQQKNAVGGLSRAAYWSSSEIDEYNAWVVNFEDGGYYSLIKINTTYVRSVRAF
jgi:Protein of unknown function (DUF1566)